MLNFVRAMHAITQAVKVERYFTKEALVKWSVIEYNRLKAKWDALDRLYGVVDGEPTKQPSESESRSFFLEWG